MTLDQIIAHPVTRWSVLVLVVSLVWYLHGAAWRRFRAFTRSRTAPGWRIAERMRLPSRFLLTVVALVLAVPILDFAPATDSRLEQASLALIIASIGWMVILAMDYSTERSLGKLSTEEEDYEGRRQATQLRVLRQSLRILIVLLTAACVLSTFEGVREYGVSLFASAGAAALVLSFAARPVLVNLIAGIQIALTQPIRMGDVVIVENEWGWIEEIRATYVVIRVWDWRRLVVPLSYFIEKPFQNWTRDSSSLIGSVNWHLDWTAPVGEMREKLRQFAEESKLWDRNVAVLQVIETTGETIELRGLVSARNAPSAWDLRCEIRERMVAWLQEKHPEALPRTRAELRHVDPGSRLKRGPREPGIRDLADPPFVKENA